jgi:chorismate mutase
VIQREAFAQWEKAGAGRFQHVPDLATEIRPKLDALTPRLLRELAAAWPALADPSQHERIAVAMQRMPGAGVHAAAASVAVAPLIEGTTAGESRLQ